MGTSQYRSVGRHPGAATGDLRHGRFSTHKLHYSNDMC